MSKVRLKSYIDAINAERARSDNARLLGVLGTGAAMFFGILTSISVYAETQGKLLSLHNDLIRKGERDAAELRATMATKDEVAPVKDYVSRETGSATTTGKMITYLFATATLAAGVGAAVMNWIG